MQASTNNKGSLLNEVNVFEAVVSIHESRIVPAARLCGHQ